MKWLLLISVLLNLLLSYAYFELKNRPPLERIIIEEVPKAAEPQKSGEVKQNSLVPQIPVKKESKNELRAYSETEFEESIQKVQSDKEEFLVNELGLDQSQLEKIQKLKMQSWQEIGRVHDKGKVGGELSFDDRRQIIDLEEKLQYDIARTVGPKRWEKFLKFRDNYNKKVIKKQIEDHTPMTLMDF